MHVIVIGAGVVGITTAWELLKDGHQVTVLEARDDVALETSFANGGQIAVTESAPWSRPHLFRDLVKQVFKEKPYRVRLRADLHQWRWMYRFWRNSNAEIYRNAIIQNWKLAQYSLACLQKTRQSLNDDFSYDDRQNGILQLVSQKQNIPALQTHREVLQQQGAKVQWLEAEALMAQEPALTHAIKQGHVRAALWGKADESGDAALFTRKLAKAFKAQGGKVICNTQVNGFILNKKSIISTETSRGEMKADVFILCAGTASRKLGRKLGTSLMILPIKGYSLTATIKDPEHAPKASLTDLSQRLVISRLGERLRVAGYAEIGMRQGIDKKRIRAIETRMNMLFPKAAHYQNGEPWAGFRPMTPDGAPLVGQSNDYENLWFNTGHGTLGWTLCHATARLTADSIKGGVPKIDMKMLNPLR